MNPRGWRGYHLHALDAHRDTFAFHGGWCRPWTSPTWWDEIPPENNNQKGVHLADKLGEALWNGYIVAEARGFGTCIRHEQGWRCQGVTIEKLWVAERDLRHLPPWTRELEVHSVPHDPRVSWHGFSLAIHREGCRCEWCREARMALDCICEWCEFVRKAVEDAKM